MRKLFATMIVMLFGLTGAIYAVNLDDFNGNDLDSMWTVRDPASKATDITVENGQLTLELAAGADMYIQGTDGGVCLLMDPPNLEDYTIEMKLNVATNDGSQAPACHVGPILFNEANWAYSIWGPYANTDIRLEDCIGGSYRWRDQTMIGVNQGDVAIDEDVWIKVVKTGTSLEFFAKGDEDADWISGGVDELLGPNYTAGDYQVGIAFKSWGGSINSVFHIDYFNIPEIAAVDAAGKLSTTWGIIKQ